MANGQATTMSYRICIFYSVVFDLACDKSCWVLSEICIYWGRIFKTIFQFIIERDGLGGCGERRKHGILSCWVNFSRSWTELFLVYSWFAVLWFWEVISFNKRTCFASQNIRLDYFKNGKRLLKNQPILWKFDD